MADRAFAEIGAMVGVPGLRIGEEFKEGLFSRLGADESQRRSPRQESGYTVLPFGRARLEQIAAKLYREDKRCK